jgi:hypothetical protein
VVKAKSKKRPVAVAEVKQIEKRIMKRPQSGRPTRRNIKKIINQSSIVDYHRKTLIPAT